MNEPIKRTGTNSDGKNWAFVTWGDKAEANYLEEIFSGSDRVAVIVSLAYIEELLRELMRSFLVNDKEINRVLNPLENGTLATFTRMVDISLLLGLLSKEICGLLKSVAILRNKFAHKSQLKSFEDFLIHEAKSSKKNSDLENFRKKASEFVKNHGTISESNIDTASLVRQLYSCIIGILETELKAAIAYAKNNQRQEFKGTHGQYSIKM